MRTKVLLLSAVLAALGVASSVAQVFSVNAVGYVNVSVPASAFAMLTNPLDQGAGNYTLDKLIPAPPDGTVIYKFSGGAYLPANFFEFGAWGDPAMTIAPGEGVFVKTPAGLALTVTFVGEVRQGAASNKTLTAGGFNMTGSLVPQAGALSAVLGFPAVDGDLVYKFNKTNQVYDPVYVFEFGDWGGREPALEVGEAVFIKPAAGANRAWDRNFTVN